MHVQACMCVRSEEDVMEFNKCLVCNSDMEEAKIENLPMSYDTKKCPKTEKFLSVSQNCDQCDDINICFNFDE